MSRINLHFQLIIFALVVYLQIIIFIIEMNTPKEMRYNGLCKYLFPFTYIRLEKKVC